MLLHEKVITFDTPIWNWECLDNYCQKVRVTNQTKESLGSLAACKLFCHSNAGLWPRPTGTVNISNELIPININNISITTQSSIKTSKLVQAATRRFKQQIASYLPNLIFFSADAEKFSSVDDLSNNFKNPSKDPEISNGYLKQRLEISLNISDISITKLLLDTDESYSIEIISEEVREDDTHEVSVHVTIASITFFGARHGLETLSQLIIFDNIRKELQIPAQAIITDKPVYPYRGLLVDTVSNYIKPKTIKRIIDGMASTKLNTFHWHITGSQSFPYVLKSHPMLSRIGAYSPQQVYTSDDILDIVGYGTENGVRVVPEFSAPCPIGEGWQDSNLMMCFDQKSWKNDDKIQEWSELCYNPPCGHFDPTNFLLYDVLQEIYGDIIDQFDPDIFHMGGEGISIACWNSSEAIGEWMRKKGWERTEAGFLKLRAYFQRKALKRFDLQVAERLDKNKKLKVLVDSWKKQGTIENYNKTSRKTKKIIEFKKTSDPKESNSRKKNKRAPKKTSEHKKVSIILWTSALTKIRNLETYLPKDRYIIQITTQSNDTHIHDVLDAGYRVILSNSDALNFDAEAMRFSESAEPLKLVEANREIFYVNVGWEKVYLNSPAKICDSHEDLVLGAEGLVWTRHTDEYSIDGRIWPRAAALGERLWAEPEINWKDVQQRILEHRERLVRRGIAAEVLTQGWCLQNEKHCSFY